ncbi:MAG: hypothetical protein KF819_17760 [Labilithrix sp.]|nr:hypothetical protein [Labilithrix sp.]
MTKSNQPELLPDELAWAEGGHASDVVLTAMADGQAEIVPAAVLAHVEGCRTCTTHLGNAALLSLHTGRELALLATESEAAARAPMPRLAIVLGLLVAVLGILPSALDASPDIGTAKTFATHDVPLLANGLSTLARRLLEPGSSVGLVLTYGAAALVILMALALVRLLPKKEVSR